MHGFKNILVANPGKSCLQTWHPKRDIHIEVSIAAEIDISLKRKDSLSEDTRIIHGK